MNEHLALHVILSLVDKGVREFCICAGSRNSPLCLLLVNQPYLKCYYWYEERSAAFFALGRARATKRPVAVIVTSGTAAGELLPAAMEAHYTGVPLILVTADRPRRFRGSGAPQAAEQVGLYGVYAHLFQDVEGADTVDLSSWDMLGVAHLNICLEEPNDEFEPVTITPLEERIQKLGIDKNIDIAQEALNTFLKSVKAPLVIVGTLKPSDRLAVKNLLLNLDVPVYLEAPSGLREDPDLQGLRVYRTNKLDKRAAQNGYPLDGVLRIGGVPTLRFWRDLEYLEGKIKLCSINQLPFSGLSWGSILAADISKVVATASKGHYHNPLHWLKIETEYQSGLQALLDKYPSCEAALVQKLSEYIPSQSHVFLGNSMPIREWDLAATIEDKGLSYTANRGLAGIDGQLSTFLGLAQTDRENWAVMGDLTALYDFAGYWILPQLPKMQCNVVIINNGGGKIFQPMYKEKVLQNCHQYSFEGMAQLWGLRYHKWNEIPQDKIGDSSTNLIELVPDEQATLQFQSEHKQWIEIVCNLSIVSTVS